MLYSIHTFELTGIETDEKYHRKKTTLARGLKVIGSDDRYDGTIRLIVNPSKLLGGDDLTLWKPTDKNIGKLVGKLEKHINENFDAGLNDFEITRCDFTANINVGSQKRVAAYIKVLHAIGKVTGFRPKFSERDYGNGIDREGSFDLVHADGVEFTVYNKWEQSRRVEATDILRVEVRLRKRKAIRKYTRQSGTAAQIAELAGQSEKIFMETFSRVVPPGEYCTLKEAVQRIEPSVTKARQREKMLRLVGLTRKDTLYAALKELDDKNADRILAKFAEINISPVTLRKRYGVNRLNCLYVGKCLQYFNKFCLGCIR